MQNILYLFTASTAKALIITAKKEKKSFPVYARDGIIKFSYSFKDEQEHLIVLEKNGATLESFSVYSLFEDLYDLKPMKFDFHSHSYRSDGQRDPAALAGHYREQGYDGFALTDHNRFYPGLEIDDAFSDVKTGFLRIPGEEVHTPGSSVHIVRLGGNKSVCDMYFREPEKYNSEVEEYMTRVPDSVPEVYRKKYALAMWATDMIHKEGGIAIFAHPYWRPSNLIYNVCDELAILFLKSGMFDAYELVGGMKQVGINRSVALWNEMRAQGINIPVVGSSDVHSIQNSPYFPFNFTICFVKDATVESVVESIKCGNTVAVEANGNDEYARQFRAYGTLRYASYASFLLTHFFSKIERLCEGEGVAMRAYLLGDASRDLIESQAALVERYRERFFGRKEPLCPGSGVLDFEEKWRKVHLDGPTTKASALYSDKITRQI